MKKCVWATISISVILSIIFSANYLLRSPDSLRPIIVYGDTRSGHQVHKRIVKAVIGKNPAAVFHTGDLVDNGSNSLDWAVFNEINSKLIETTKFYPCLGNHEYNSELFFDNFVLPGNERWYSVAIGHIGFIVLDSNSDLGRDSEQYQWFEDNLAGIDKKVKFLAVIFHHPLFSSVQNKEDEKNLKSLLLSLFEKYGVDIVFSGHSHGYERLRHKGIYYVVTGGGGAPLYNRSHKNPSSQLFIKKHHFCHLSAIGNRLAVKVFDINLNCIDIFSMIKNK